jgi:hypothetical protein
MSPPCTNFELISIGFKETGNLIRIDIYVNVNNICTIYYFYDK